MKTKITFKGLWEVLKNSFNGFLEDKVPKLSASLAYYTVFSMGPLLIVIIYICSIFFGREAIEGTIDNQMQSFVGPEAAKQIQEIIKNASISGKGGTAAIIGITFLLIGATTVFGEIQDSINTIWGLKAKPKLGIMKLLQTRLVSFGLIGSLGFLLLVSLGVTTLVEALSGRLRDFFPDVTIVIFYIVNLLLTLGVVTAVFAVIFKVLPDAKIKWKDVWAGAIVTAVLFAIGKFGISLFITKSDVGGTYGSAGSLVILLLWIYYSSFILYFGAEFTKAYAMKYAGEIHPNKYAVATKKVEVEEENASIQQVEEKKNDVVEGKAPPQPDKKTKKPVADTEEYAEEYYPVSRKTIFKYKRKRDEKKKVGLLTVLGGLLLYFINNSSRKTEETRSK